MRRSNNSKAVRQSLGQGTTGMQTEQLIKRVGELACCMHELSLAHGLGVWQNEQYNMRLSEQCHLMNELKHACIS